jgi:ParB-like chromosome segregation protein Spo0J
VAKKSSLPNIDALIGNIRPYGDGEAETGKPALIRLETIRLDMGQPRRLLPADLAEQIHYGTLTLVQAMQVWARQSAADLSPDLQPDEPTPANWQALRLQKVRELAASIIHLGLIHPVNVIPQADGSHLLETGERRVLAMAWLVACGLSEYERIPALFVSQSASHRSRQVIENLSREDLNAVEKARGLWNIRYEMSGLPNPAWDSLGPPLGEELERPNLVPWTDVQRQVSIGKRYRIWLTQTMELAPAVIKIIEQYGLPERATRPLVQFLRDDPAGQAQVLESIISGAAQNEDSTPDWSPSHIEACVMQYLADVERARVGTQTKGVPQEDAGADNVKLALAAKRAMRSLHRAIGSKTLGRKGLAQITNELLSDDETVEIAKQIKPLVDALAAAARRKRS